MASLVGFDLEDYFANTNHNVKGSMALLAPYLGHFQVVWCIFQELQGSIDLKDLEGNLSRIVRFHFLASSSINFVKAVTNVLSGHLTDANIFSRRTFEAVRYSMFLRECPDEANLWIKTVGLEGQKFFSGKFNNWLSYSGGKGEKKIETELPIYSDYWPKLNHVGPHSNFPLLSFQTEFSFVDGYHKFSTKFHEVESGDRGTAMLIQYFFTHVFIHYYVLQWWINLADLPFKVSKQQISFWKDSEGPLEAAFSSVLPYLQKHLSLKGQARS